MTHFRVVMQVMPFVTAALADEISKNGGELFNQILTIDEFPGKDPESECVRISNNVLFQQIKTQ